MAGMAGGRDPAHTVSPHNGTMRARRTVRRMLAIVISYAAARGLVLGLDLWVLAGCFYFQSLRLKSTVSA